MAILIVAVFLSRLSRYILRSCPVILIEPHDFMLPGKACLAPLLSALEGQDRDVLISGENLVFLDQASLQRH